MPASQKVKFALEFPQGLVVITESGGAYFKPQNSNDAFTVPGERKELFGKNAIIVQQDYASKRGGYAVVYEFGENGNDVRLVRGQETIKGKLADDATVQALNDRLANDTLRLYSTRDTQPRKVFNAARFSDGRMLLHFEDKRELYIGTPGNYQRVDAQQTIQGGNSLYYKTADGVKISLPWSFGGPPDDEMPMYGDEVLNYASRGNDDPAKFGFVVPEPVKPLDPFSSEVCIPKPTAPVSAKNAFKP